MCELQAVSANVCTRDICIYVCRQDQGVCVMIYSVMPSLSRVESEHDASCSMKYNVHARAAALPLLARPHILLCAVCVA